MVDDNIEIEINESDCASTPIAPRAPAASTSTPPTRAVRITHIPTGIVVQCQNERSQHKNRAIAWAMLQGAALRAGAQEARGEGQARRTRPKTDIGWGHQIRSYVLQPYQLVKDLRTGARAPTRRRARRRPRPLHRGGAGPAHSR